MNHSIRVRRAYFASVDAHASGFEFLDVEVAMKEKGLKMSVMVGVLCSLFLVLSLIAGGRTQAAERPKCIACHEKVTPGVVTQFLAGKMGKSGMDCSACHGFDHMS